jgi:hypothetical protein
LLLQRHLRIACTAGAHHGTEGSTGRRTNRRTPTAADGRTEAGAECRREDRAPHRLIGRGIGLGCGLARGILLTHSLIGGKGAELLVRAGDDRDRRRHRRRNACAESNRHRQNADYAQIDMPHASPLLSTKRSRVKAFRKTRCRSLRALREHLPILILVKDQDDIR